MNVSKRSEFYLGVRAVAPILIGVIPFGLTFGVLGPEYGFTPIQTFLMSSIIFAGAITEDTISDICYRLRLRAAELEEAVRKASKEITNVRDMLGKCCGRARGKRLQNFYWICVLGRLA